jgi:hypothetical protein
MPIIVKKPNSPGADQSGATAVMEKVERLSAERAKLKERWQANNAAWSDAVAAGRLFGVEVKFPSDMERLAPGGLPRVQPRHEQTNLFAPIADGSIRAAVLERLQKAGEAGIKGAEIRREIENKLGRKLHEKTIGMTLYRLSLKGLSRREGITWYYVPQGTKMKAPAS